MTRELGGKMDLHFLGGALEIGGSSILLQIDNKNILFDAGIRQGTGKDPIPNYRVIGECGGLDAIIISHAHLDHIGSEARKLGLGQILEKMEREDTFIKAPAILAGDFNAFPDSEELKLLHEYPQLIDLTADIKGTYHDYGRLKETEKIDYIIAEDNIRCNHISVWTDCKDGVYLSDHYPVCAEIQIK